MSEVSRFSKKIDDGDDEEKNDESEMTAGPLNANITSNYKDVQKLESFANIREVGQLKKHLGRIEEIYIGLAKSWKDSEENQEHVIIYLEDQLKAAKSSLVEYQITATEEINAVREQMKELQEKLSKQHTEDIVELSKVIKEKETTEQTLSETKGLIAELNANLTIQKRRVEQTVNELNKRTKELSSASQEISFLKIQLEAEKDILKSTVKNHDQVLGYLKEQLSTAESNLSYASASDEEIVETDIVEFQEQIVTQHEDDILEPSAFILKIAEEALNCEKANNEVITPEIVIPRVELVSGNETFQKSPIQTAQKTREELKLRLQGLQAVSELDKRNTELKISSSESNAVKAQTNTLHSTSKVVNESQDQTPVDEGNSNVVLKERGERDKVNKNISATSEKTNRFW